MLSVCSWNVRRLTSRPKHNAVTAVVIKFNYGVVCLQESKVKHVSGSFLRSVARSFLNKCVFLESDGASGGVITCWSSRAYTCHDLLVRNYSITVRLTHDKIGKNFYVTNVYGLATWDGKEEFYSELAQLKRSCEGRWIICGDFNSIRSQEKRKGKTWSARATDRFNELIREQALIDPPMRNQSFMWSNMQKNPTLARLDRFLVSTEWDLDFPLSRVEALPRVTSDHCSILLTVEKHFKKRKKMFRFEDAWLNHEGFIDKVPGWWKEQAPEKSAVLTITEKLRHCRQRIKEWCKLEFYSISGLKNELMTEIHEIDKADEQDNLTEEGGLKRDELKAKLRGVLNDEASMWRTWANQHWLQEGDRKTKYFHSIANGRQRANGISEVLENGRVYQSEEEKQAYFFQYFEERFTPDESTPISFGEWSGLFSTSRVSAAQLTRLNEQFSIDEIKQAVFQLGSDKAPGPDGFSLRFYQTF